MDNNVYNSTSNPKTSNTYIRGHEINYYQDVDSGLKDKDGKAIHSREVYTKEAGKWEISISRKVDELGKVTLSNVTVYEDQQNLLDKGLSERNIVRLYVNVAHGIVNEKGLDRKVDITIPVFVVVDDLAKALGIAKSALLSKISEKKLDEKQKIDAITSLVITHHKKLQEEMRKGLQLKTAQKIQKLSKKWFWSQPKISLHSAKELALRISYTAIEQESSKVGDASKYFRALNKLGESFAKLVNQGPSSNTSLLTEETEDSYGYVIGPEREVSLEREVKSGHIDEQQDKHRGKQEVELKGKIHHEDITYWMPRRITILSGQASGNFKTVTFGTHLEEDRKVALQRTKNVQLDKLNEEELEAFLNEREEERETLYNLRGVPHMMPYYEEDITLEGGERVWVQEKMDYDSRQIIGKNPEVLIPILSQIAEGLAGMHNAGYVHLDVKPDNMLIKEIEKEEGNDQSKTYQAFIADLGITKRINSNEMSGTREFMAPEMYTAYRKWKKICADIFELNVLESNLQGNLKLTTDEFLSEINKLGIKEEEKKQLRRALTMKGNQFLNEIRRLKREYELQKIRCGTVATSKLDSWSLGVMILQLCDPNFIVTYSREPYAVLTTDEEINAALDGRLRTMTLRCIWENTITDIQLKKYKHLIDIAKKLMRKDPKDRITCAQAHVLLLNIDTTIEEENKRDEEDI